VRGGLVDDPGHRKIHEQTVPLAGGWAIATGLMVPLVLAVLILFSAPRDLEPVHTLTSGLAKRLPQLAAILAGALGMLALGAVDDKWDLRPAAKFAGQLLVAALVALAGVRVTLFVPNLVFSYAITLLWILTVTNAFNFVDNMNGLCAGLGVVAGAWFGFIAAHHGQYLVTCLAFLVCGAIAGFLPHNFPRATAFLGDAGSHLVGYLMAILAILPDFYSPEHPRGGAVLSPLLVLAVPLLDLVWVVLLRWRLGRPIYVGDLNHLSHHLVRRGLNPPRAVALIWIVSALLGSVVLLWL
jgi:UDP-GlcNAc:undecaprenyl-phosphate GlcNAc-1-phosphate transferase